MLRMINMAKACLFVGLTVTLSACLGPGTVPQSTLTHVAANVQYYDPRLNPVDNAWYDKDIFVALRPINGAVFGAPENQALIKKAVEGTPRFDIALHEIAAKLASQASPLTAGDGNTGLQLNPSTVKISRLAGFAYDRLGRSIGAASFIDPVSREYLLLCYITEPSLLRGEVNAGGTRYDFNVLVQSGGFHWLRVQNIGAGHFKVSAAGDDGESVGPVHFAIQVRGSAEL